MSLSTAIYAALSQLDDPIYPVFAPLEAVPPWVTYRINQSSDEDELTFTIDGTMNPYWAVVYITIWSLNYNLTDSKVEEYLQSLLNYKSEEIQQIFYFGREDLGDPDLNLFGAQLKLKCFTREV